MAYSLDHFDFVKELDGFVEDEACRLGREVANHTDLPSAADVEDCRGLQHLGLQLRELLEVQIRNEHREIDRFQKLGEVICAFVKLVVAKRLSQWVKAGSTNNHASCLKENLRWRRAGGFEETQK